MLAHEVTHRLPKAGTITEPVATGSNTAKVKIGTEQIALTGNCYVPTAHDRTGTGYFLLRQLKT